MAAVPDSVRVNRQALLRPFMGDFGLEASGGWA